MLLLPTTPGSDSSKNSASASQAPCCSSRWGWCRLVKLLLAAVLVVPVAEGSPALKGARNRHKGSGRRGSGGPKREHVGESYNCSKAPAVPGDRRPDKTRLRIVTFNTEWLFLAGANGSSSSGKCPGSGCPWPDAAAAQEHAEAVGAVLRSLDGDVVHLCEVQGCDELAFLLQGPLAGLGYEGYLVRGADHQTGQNTALLTRIDPIADLARSNATAHYPLPGTTCSSSAPPGEHGCSKHYHTLLPVPGLARPLGIVGAHLLAVPQDRGTRCHEREAQASVLRSTVLQPLLDQGHEVVMLGDLNDFDGQVPDVNGHQPVSRVLTMLKQGPGGANSSSSSAVELLNAAQAIEQSERYTDWWDKDGDCHVEPRELSQIDHVLLSPGLAPLLTRAWIGNHLYAEGCGTNQSDHWPMVLDLALPPPPAAAPHHTSLLLTRD